MNKRSQVAKSSAHFNRRNDLYVARQRARRASRAAQGIPERTFPLPEYPPLSQACYEPDCPRKAIVDGWCARHKARIKMESDDG